MTGATLPFLASSYLFALSLLAFGVRERSWVVGLSSVFVLACLTSALAA